MIPQQAPHQQTNGSNNKQFLVVQIVDTGVGVAPAQQESLFEVFNQAQCGQLAGTGLGLFSVYSRCTRLGGACGVISPNMNDEGCTFWFTIPYLPTTPELIKVSDFARFPTSHAVCDYCLPGSMVVMGIDVTWKKDKSDEMDQKISLKSVELAAGESESDMAFTAFVVDDVQSIRKLLKRTLFGLRFTRGHI